MKDYMKDYYNHKFNNKQEQIEWLELDCKDLIIENSELKDKIHRRNCQIKELQKKANILQCKIPKLCDRTDCRYYFEQDKYLVKCTDCLQQICKRCFQCNYEACQAKNLFTDQFETI